MKSNGKHPYRSDFSPMLSDDEFMEAFANNKETFKHLQVFMSKTGKTDVGDLMFFLGKNTFGIVRIEGISYVDELIILDLYDILGNKEFKYSINIFKRDFQCMLYKLQDIRDMINQALRTQADNHFDEGDYSDKDVEDLLELDENQS